jgi:hypothetical protein
MTISRNSSGGIPVFRTIGDLRKMIELHSDSTVRRTINLFTPETKK